MGTKNSIPTSEFMQEDECPSCRSKCNIFTDLDEQDYCNDCRPSKKSEQLKLESQQEENDYKSWSLRTKSLREARLERFEENNYIIQLQQSNCIVIPFDGRKVVIDTQTDKYGILDYFPKANKVLIRKKNKWEAQGLKWMFNNIFPKK